MFSMHASHNDTSHLMVKVVYIFPSFNKLRHHYHWNCCRNCMKLRINNNHQPHSCAMVQFMTITQPIDTCQLPGRKTVNEWSIFVRPVEFLCHFRMARSIWDNRPLYCAHLVQTRCQAKIG